LSAAEFIRGMRARKHSTRRKKLMQRRSATCRTGWTRGGHGNLYNSAYAPLNFLPIALGRTFYARPSSHCAIRALVEA